MNNRGSMFFSVIIAIFLFSMGVLFIPFLADDITTFRTEVGCSDSSISSGTMLSCLITDAVMPYLIWFFTSISIGFIIGGRI